MDEFDRSILVVDDEAQLARNYELLFAEEGWRSKAAFGGREAIETLRRQAFSVVLLDMRMPQMDGFETLAAILKIRPTTCVAFFTAYEDVPAAVRALREGAWTMISKGYRFEEIHATVEAAFNQRSQLEREKMAAEREKAIRAEQELAFARKEVALQLAAGVNHQIGNRLADFGWSLLSLKKRNSLDVEARAAIADLEACLDLVRLSVDKLRHITNDRQLQPTDVDARSAVSAAHDIACRRHRMHRTGCVEFDNAVEASVRVFADGEAFREALECLFDNSIQAMVPAGGRLRIEAKEEGKLVTFLITDTGPGFAQEVLTKAHLAGVSTRKQSHTGLGLMYVDQFAKESGGSMEYGNRPDGGAWVRLRLPRT